ncbi:STAS-like domain-containing protein [Providencia sp. PROV236]|uniref:STAS-like domain-containing protein n=1 Tax=Providencia sp. PROV236 TaxID=2936798 RepID=UPI0034E2F4DB
MSITIKLTDFTKHPLGRYKSDSSGSGEAFRSEKLLPILKNSNEKLIINLDGTKGAIGSSFLEEAFGGLIRLEGFTLQELQQRLIIETVNEMYQIQIKKFLTNAEKLRLAGKTPSPKGPRL